MFEYLMPNLVFKEYEGSAYAQTSRAAVLQQMKYARAAGIPWRYLVREEEALSLLLAPPFYKTTKSPGYIKNYIPGMRGSLHYHTRTRVKGCCNAAAERRNEKRRLRLIFTVRAVSLGQHRTENCVQKMSPSDKIQSCGFASLF